MNADLVAERAALVKLIHETEARRTEMIISFANCTGVNDQYVEEHFKRLDNMVNVLTYMHKRSNEIDRTLKTAPAEVYGETKKDLEAAALELCNALEYASDSVREKREEVIDALLSAGLGETLVFQEILH
jgi:ABC-type transporter Mla subunit MlaD